MSKFSLTAQLNLQAPTNTKQILNKIKSDLKGVSVPIEAKGGASTVKELNKVAKSTQDVQKQTKAAATQFDRLGKSVGKALTHVARFDVARRIFYGFASAVEQGITDAIQFERELLRVSQVAQTSMKNLSGLSKTITNLSTSLGVTSGSLAKTALILKQTGLSIKDVQIAMGALAKTELAPTFDNIATTAETAVAAMRQFRLEASQLEGLLGKINVVAGQFAVESRDIGQAIIRTGGAFKAAGGNVEELIALFTSVRATTRETAETIATGFRTIFTRLQRPKTIEFLRQFGIELTDLNGKFVGPYEAVSRLNKALSGLDSTDLRFSAIVEQLGGFRQVSKVIPLIQEFGTAQAALAAQQGGANSLTNDAAKAQAALAVQLAKVKEEMKALMRDVVASEGFQIMIKGAMGLARALVKVGEAITPLIPLLTAMATIKLGSMALGGFGSMMGRKQAGGRISRFSQGGWVPGSGNGDTVPALLEPGEFVLRKSAAQALGSSLNGVNRYASGGISKMSSGFARGNTIRQNLDPSKKATEAFVEGKHGFTHRSDAQDKVIGTVNYDKFSLNKIAFNKDGSPKYGYKGLLQGYATGNAMTQGSIFEEILAKAGKIQQSTGFGGSHPLDGTYKGGYAEVKRTAVNENVILDKLLRHENKQNKLKGIGLTGDADPIKFDKTVTQITDSTNLGVLKKKLYANRPKKAKKKATGGGIFGSGLSPVLLTPGEFVVNKSSARAIGYGKLGAMNKYATGGSVGKGGVKRFFGGGMMGAGSMGGVDPMMLMGMETLNKSAKDASGSIMQMGTGAVTAYAGFQMAGGAAKSLADQFGMGGEGLDMVVDGATRGLGAFKAMEAASAKMPKWLSNSIAKIPGAMDPKKFASGGMFGGTKMLSGKKGEDIAGRLKSAEKGVVEAQAHADAMRASTESIKENFRADDKARTARLEEIKTSKAVVAAKMKEIEAAKKAEMIAGGARKNVGKDAVQMALRKDKGGAWMQLASEEVGLETERKSVSGKQRYERGKVKRDLKDGAKKNVEARKSLGLAKKENAAAEKRSKVLKRFSMGLQLAAAAVGVFAGKMKEDAMNTIKEGNISGGRGEAAVQKAGMAGALGGAASGAQAGAMFGPLGMVVGGAVGALKGFIDATNEAKEALRQRRFDDANKKSTEAMEQFSKKTLSAQGALRQTIQANQEMSGNVKAGKEGQNFFKQQEANTKVYLDNLAASAQSVEQFDSQISSMLPNLKAEGLIRQAQIDAMKKEITARLEAQAKMQDLADARQEEINNIKKLKGTLSAFNEATYRSKETMNALSQTATPGGVVNLGGGIAGKLRPGSTDKESIDRLEKTIDQLTNVAGEGVGGTFGTGMGRFAQDAKSAAFVQRNVDTMVLAASQGGSLTEDSFSKALLEQLEGAKEREKADTGFEMSDKSMSRMKAVIAGLGPDIARDLNDPSKREGAIKSVEEALKGSQQEMLDGFLAVAKQVDDHVRRMQGLYDKRNKLEMQYVTALNKSVQMRYDAEQQYLKNIGVSKFGGPTDDQVQENFKSQQRNLLSQGGLDTGMAGNVDKLSSAFSEVRGKLDQNTKALASQDLEAAGLGDMPMAEGMNKLAEENAKLSKQYGILKTALQENTNSTQRLSALQEALKREQEKQKTLEQLTFDASYGTAEEKDTAARLINAMNTAMQAGTVSAVDPSQQRQVAQMLMRLGPEGEKIVRKDQNKFLGMSGVAPTAAGGIDYQGITSASEKQIEIAGKILAIQESGAKAQDALAGDVKTSVDNMGNTIAEANRAFLDELKSLLFKNFERDIKQDKVVNQAAAESMGSTRSDFKRLGYDLGANTETEDRLTFMESAAGNIRAQGRKARYGDAAMRIQASGPAGAGGIGHMATIMDEFGANNIGDALQAADDDVKWSSGAFTEGIFGANYGSQTETSLQKRNSAAALSLMVGSGQKRTRESLGGMKHQTRDFTKGDVSLLSKLEGGNLEAARELGGRVRKRLLPNLVGLGGEEFAKSDKMKTFTASLGQLSKASDGDAFGVILQDVLHQYEALREAAEAAGKSDDGFARPEDIAAGVGTKRTGAKQDDLYGEIRDQILAAAMGIDPTDKSAMEGFDPSKDFDASKVQDEFEFGDRKVKKEELLSTSGKSYGAQAIRELVADRLLELTGQVRAQGGASGFVEKEKGIQSTTEEIKAREAEAKAIQGSQAVAPDAAPVEKIASSTVTQEGYLKGLYEEGVQKKSSIAVRDAHCEAILLRIAAALEGGNGTASNPTSDTGGVAFTQSLDSRGFQDGVDKFSQTVDGLREVMAGALTIEVGGTVTLDINLKEGAGFLQDSQNALGVLVSGKINDAINNFIRNGLKDARINTGSWAADDSGTALASNSNTSGGMGLS